MQKLIDTHCHLDLLENLNDVLDHAQENGIGGMITIGTRWSQREKQKALLQKNDILTIWGALGTHPDHVHEEYLPEIDEMLQELNNDDIVGIGETGLDFFHGKEVDVRPLQEKSFRRHIEASRITGKPTIIHSRLADQATCDILNDEYKKGAFPFLLHCFAGGYKLAETVINLGGYISFSGLLTFPKCDIIREVARWAPKDRIVVETDSPFLAPVPQRGKKNKPGYVRHTAEFLAKERHMEISDIISQTSKNAKNLFNLSNF